MSDTIYGRHPVLEVLKSEAAVNRVIIAEGTQATGVMAEIVAAAAARQIPVEYRNRQQVARLVEAEANHQGVIAQIPPYRYSTVEAIVARATQKGEPPLLLLLDGIQDVHNLGALIRTAEGVGAHGVIIPERRAVGITPTVFKSSAGAVTYLPIAQVVNLTTTIKQLQAQGIWFVGLDMEGSQPYYRANLKGPLGIVVGAEGKGLGRLVAESCDFLVHLPMLGQISSLNASVAGGVLLYEALRQRN